MLKGNEIKQSLSIDHWANEKSNDLKLVINKLDPYVDKLFPSHSLLNKPFWDVESREINSALRGHRANLFYFDHTNDMNDNIFHDTWVGILQFIFLLDETFVLVINHWDNIDTRRGVEFSIQFLKENMDYDVSFHVEVHCNDGADFAVFVISLNPLAESIQQGSPLSLPPSYQGLIPHLYAFTPQQDQPFSFNGGSVWIGFQVKYVPVYWIKNQMISVSIWTTPIADFVGDHSFTLLDHITDFTKTLYGTSHPGLVEIEVFKLINHQNVDFKVRFVVHVKPHDASNNFADQLQPISRIPYFIKDTVLHFGATWPRVLISYSTTVEPTAIERKYISQVCRILSWYCMYLRKYYFLLSLQ